MLLLSNSGPQTQLTSQEGLQYHGNVRVNSNCDHPPPGRTPGNLTLKKKYHQIFDGAGETHCQIPNGAGKKHSQMPISASYVSHIILREQNQLDFKCLFNFIFTVKTQNGNTITLPFLKLLVKLLLKQILQKNKQLQPF